ncbi:MAG TPA: recombinase A [Polyangiaceae bacterium]|jgi:recombination protein RecA
MALPQKLLEQLPKGVSSALGGFSAPPSLPLGPELSAALPDGGLPRGAVVELAVSGGASFGTRIALEACRSAQAERSKSGEVPWCAFIDPSGTLFGPGVQQAGVELERLLVVRPPLEAIGRVALRMAESQVFSVMVVDTVGVPGCLLKVQLGRFPRIVRRLSIAVDGTLGLVLLITDSTAYRPLPLPVAQRIELSRPSQGELQIRIAKDKWGRVSKSVARVCTERSHSVPAPDLSVIRKLRWVTPIE